MKTQDKEFQGRSLDEAIGAACAHFDLPREKLEIDILSDAKAGIFGLMGTKKAKIIARPAPVLESFSMSLQMSKDNAGESKFGREGLRSARERSPGQERDADREQPQSKPSRDSGRDFADNGPREEKADFAPSASFASPGDDAQSGRAASVSAAAEVSKTESNDAAERPGGEREARPERRGRGDRPARGGSRNDGRARGPRREPQAAPKTAENEAESDEPRREGSYRDRRRAGLRDARERRDSEGRERHGAPRRPERDLREDARRGKMLTNSAKLEKNAENEDLFNDQRIAYEGLPEVCLAELDCEKLTAVAREVMDQILRKLCPEAEVSVSLGEERVDVSVDCDDAAALLIGREGQTLAAMQYLLTRIVGRAMGAAVNIHLDIGAYRRRQDDKLRELSKILAERVRGSGRPQFTRPLSSYHRRIVHMTLQDEADLITRSKGEGALKRVSVTLRNGNPAAEQTRGMREDPRGNGPEKNFSSDADAEFYDEEFLDIPEQERLDEDAATASDRDGSFRQGAAR